MRRFPWHWALVAILTLAGVGLLFLDRWAAEAATRSGRAAVNNKDYPQAIEYFNRAIQIDPRYAPAYHGRGLAYLNQGDLDRAIADFSEAVRLDPNDARAWYHRGLAFSRAGDYDRALTDLGEAIHLNPDYAAAYMTRSWVYAKKGDDAQARADRQKAIELDPGLEQAAAESRETRAEMRGGVGGRGEIYVVLGALNMFGISFVMFGIRSLMTKPLKK